MNREMMIKVKLEATIEKCHVVYDLERLSYLSMIHTQTCRTRAATQSPSCSSKALTYLLKN